jgi:asparagine synthase (glutamine-hydrolysing)
MHNFYAHIYRKKFTENPDASKSIMIQSATIESSDVLTGDSFVFENDEYYVLFDGIIFNLSSLMNAYSARTIGELFILLNEMLGDGFAKVLNGNFRGVIVIKKFCRACIFTDKKASKPIFYFLDDDEIHFAGSFDLLIKNLHQKGIKTYLDETAATMLLLIGYLLEDYTLADCIKKLVPGCALFWELDGKMEIKRYHQFTSGVKVELSQDDIINSLDNLFASAIRLEYSKDIELARSHLCTLSGGLDSRSVAVVSTLAGYKSVFLTLSDSGYLDDVYARKISRILGSEYLFHSLDPGDYLASIEDSIIANGGAISYTGSAHLRYVLKRINTNSFGVLHTGLLGDAVLGSYLGSPKIRKATMERIYPGVKFFNIEKIIGSTMEKYESEELFKLYQRGFNAVNNGYFSTNDIMPISSPFLEDDFLAFALSIPENLRYQEKIYRRWITKTYPIVNRVNWERTGLPPRFSPRFRFLTKGIKFVVATIKGNSRLNTSMNPEEYYLKSNPTLRNSIMDYLNCYTELLDNKSNLKITFSSDGFLKSFNNQANLITLIGAKKLFKLL